jgi:hypothetical protein
MEEVSNTKEVSNMEGDGLSLSVSNTEKVPSRIFIVPYRNRSEHKVFFCKYMKFILEDITDYEVYFSHQCDSRSFNRGAIKNIGFLAMKAKYPNDYKNITFIFNDIDTMPYHKLFDYTASPSIVKHYYGFKYALGGIVAITGLDFERINGYPNFWGWGMEDNVLQKRCERQRMIIDRTNFYPIGSREMLQLFDGVSRIISKKDPWRATFDNGIDGLHTIHLLKYTVAHESLNPQDNIIKEENFEVFFINVTAFMTGYKHEEETYVDYDLRDPPRKITHPSKIAPPLSPHSPLPHLTPRALTTPPFQPNSNNRITDDWTNIPSRANFAENNVDKMVKKEAMGLRQTKPQYVTPSTNKPSVNQLAHVSRANLFSFSKRL